MSIEIQKQIRENSQDVSTALGDLVKWTEELDKQERRREVQKVAKAKGVQEAKKLLEATAPAPKVVKKEAKSTETPEDAIKRDKTPMAQYYADWDHYDPEKEVEKIEDEAFETQRAEFLQRKAEKDKILDEMALDADGGRTRTSAARPRVKISVRQSGRRVSPVDLAAPRKEEANRLFAAGRYREAIISYSAALDCLEKYEPPQSQAVSDSGDGQKEGDCTGQDTEAMTLKTALLANRALALLKMEDWRECCEDCTEALRFDPGNHKATLRRGFALARLKRWGIAEKDLAKAVQNDPADKKASAELQMVRRMLAEQAKEARAHAKATMIDPTRSQTMPTRRLTVKVRRAGEELQAPKPAEPAASEAVSRDAVNGGGIPAEAPVRTRQPYVPRSVRMRGRQQPVGATAISELESGGATGSKAKADTGYPVQPSMNFYTFEAQWNRLRSKPRERALLLQKIGSRGLPALFRESLDSELVASIVEAVGSDIEAAARDEGQGSTAAKFATEALKAVSRTNRFDLALSSLTSDERIKLDQVLLSISSADGCTEAELESLQTAYRPPPAPRPTSPREKESNETAPPPKPSSPKEKESEEKGLVKAADEEPDEDDVPEDGQKPPEPGFSLDDCD